MDLIQLLEGPIAAQAAVSLQRAPRQHGMIAVRLAVQYFLETGHHVLHVSGQLADLGLEVLPGTAGTKQLGTLEGKRG